MTGKLPRVRTLSLADAPEAVYVASFSASALDELRRRLIMGGVSPAVARGLVAWVIAGGDLGGGVSPATRSRYRAILRRLDAADGAT